MDRIEKLRCRKGPLCSVVVLCDCRACKKYAASVELAFSEEAILSLPEDVRWSWRLRRLMRIGR